MTAPFGGVFGATATHLDKPPVFVRTCVLIKTFCMYNKNVVYRKQLRLPLKAKAYRSVDRIMYKQARN